MPARFTFANMRFIKPLRHLRLPDPFIDHGEAQQLLARQQLAVAMDRARTAATQSAAPAAALESE